MSAAQLGAWSHAPGCHRRPWDCVEPLWVEAALLTAQGQQWLTQASL